MAKVKFIKDEEPNIKALSSDNVLDGAIYVATDTGNMFLGMSDGALLSIGGSDSIDTNTTYTLTKSGSNIILTGSDGSTYTVSDDNTTYTLDQDMGSLACSIYLYGPGYSSTKAKIPVMQGATSSSVGEIGLVPEQPINPYPERVFLNSQGIWINPIHTIGPATSSQDGFMSVLDREKLDGIEEGANAYVLPQATSSVLGGVKVGSNLTVSSGVLSVSKDNVTSALGYTPLPLSGGTMNGTATIAWADSGNWGNNSGVTFPVARGGLKWSGQSDGIELYAEETESDNLELILKFTDDNSNGLTIRNSAGTTVSRLDAYGNFSGTAAQATKLSSSAGSATSPIYFSNGKPVACTYSLNKTVPSNAVFTDTTDTVVVSSTQPTSSTCKLWIIP